MALSNRDLDELKPQLNETVKQVIGFSEPTVVNAAFNCISTGFDMKKTVDQLSQILEMNQASVLAERVYHLYESYRTSSRGTKKRRKENEDEITKKKRIVDEEIEITDIPPLTSIPTRPKNTLPNLIPQGPMLSPDKIKEMMANAQKMIQERKAQLQVVMPVVPSVPPQKHVGPTDAAMNKAKRAAELHAQIQARLSVMPGSMPPPLIPGLQGLAGQQQMQMPPLAGPSPLILNEEGKTIDAKTGETIQLTLYTPTLKANIRAKRREQFKGLIERPPEEISESKFFDPRLSLKAVQRQKRGFKFHEKGKFEQQATRLRAKAQLERLQAEISQAAKRTGIASAAKIATIAPKKEIKEGEVPDIEWWDSYILKRDSYEEVSDAAGDIDSQAWNGITNLVEHPTQLAPPVKPKEDTAIPVYLTKKERKKLRRQNRREAEKELQEKIRLGLAPPMEPKVRMANLMRVLGTEAVQDPTKVEAHVRNQMAKRQRQHEEANAARKLTVEQRRDKKIAKIQEDTSNGVNVSIYRVRDLSDPAIKFKVEKNASQLYMTGLTVLYKDCNVVVVEGGPKQQRKFRQLMLHRIKWAEAQRRVKDKEDKDEDGSINKINKCVLVWEGMVRSRSFDEMKFKICPTESFAREQLKKHGVEHYWDLAFSSSVLELAGEDS